MGLFKQVVMEDTVEIKTTPEKIWDFCANLDKNYKAWHPEDHILLRWEKGKPLEEGSVVYGEEIVGGKYLKLRLKCADVTPNRKFSLKFSFPKSFFVRYEYRIEPKGNNATFTALSYIRYPFFASKSIEAAMKKGEKHVREEGENMKAILEGKQT